MQKNDFESLSNEEKTKIWEAVLNAVALSKESNSIKSIASKHIQDKIDLLKKK